MRRLYILSLLAMMIALGIGGCGGGSGGTSADPLGTDSLTFGDATGSVAIQLNPNEAVALKATVKNASGTAVVGREVSFGFVSNASEASLTSYSANTNGAGEATILYRAGAAAGSDVVRASISNGAKMDVNITVAGLQIALEASETSRTAGQNSTLTATVTDSENKPVLGQSVTFVLFSDNSGATLTTLNGTATDTTDASGKVKAIYTAGVNNPTLEVEDTVMAGIVGASTAIIMTRTVSGGGGGADFKMTITAIPESLSSGQMSVITATVLNADDDPVVGQTVNFEFVVNNSGAALTVVRAKTDSAGKAIATYTAGSGSSGISIQDAVTASATNATGTYSAGAVIITRTAATAPPIFGITVTATPATLTLKNSDSIIKATVTSTAGAVNGLTVTFTVTGGGTVVPAWAITDGSGNAVTVFTGDGISASNQTDVVKASITVGGNTYTDATLVTYP